MSKRELTARQIKTSQNEDWESLVKKHGTVFDSIRWTDMFAPSLKRIGLFDNGDNLVGGFTIWEQNRYKIRIVRNPPFTPHVGPFYESKASNPASRTDEQRLIMKSILQFLKQCQAKLYSLHFAIDIKDCLPFYWDDWKTISHYTYQIEFENFTEEISQSFSSLRRKNIRKALKDGLVAKELTDPEIVRKLVKTTYSRHDKSFPVYAMDRILESYPPGSNSFAFVSLQDNIPVSTVFVVYDDFKAYYVMGGYADGAHHGAGALAMLKAIETTREMGIPIFDFMGSSVPSIEKYFRGFGGELMAYPGVHKAWLPLEMVMKYKFRNLF